MIYPFNFVFLYLAFQLSNHTRAITMAAMAIGPAQWGATKRPKPSGAMHRYEAHTPVINSAGR